MTYVCACLCWCAGTTCTPSAARPPGWSCGTRTLTSSCWASCSRLAAQEVGDQCRMFGHSIKNRSRVLVMLV